jgi:hypothetical protein
MPSSPTPLGFAPSDTPLPPEYQTQMAATQEIQCQLQFGLPLDQCVSQLTATVVAGCQLSRATSAADCAKRMTEVPQSTLVAMTAAATSP